MVITKKSWRAYVKALSAIDKRAAGAMQYWMQDNPDADVDDLIYTANLLADRYGEAAGTLACEMYDATAAAQGVAVPAAEPAETATYQETAKAVRGTKKNKLNSVPATTGRLVKQVAADTMLQNAKRDGAQFAWVPNGDTCAYCLMMAARGWQKVGEKGMKNGHAEHIHANCDCTYAVRFDGESAVEGYDPERYREMYDHAEGSTPQEKINAMRREFYARDKAEINAQKRSAYAKRRELERTNSDELS